MASTAPPMVQPDLVASRARNTERYLISSCIPPIQTLCSSARSAMLSKPNENRSVYIADGDSHALGKRRFIFKDAQHGVSDIDVDPSNPNIDSMPACGASNADRGHSASAATTRDGLQIHRWWPNMEEDYRRPAEDDGPNWCARRAQQS